MTGECRRYTTVQKSTGNLIKKCHFSSISYQPPGLSSFLVAFLRFFWNKMYSMTLDLLINVLTTTYQHTTTNHWQQHQKSRDLPKSTIKYQSHTYTMNEITCNFFNFLSIYIQYDDILIEIYLNDRSYHQFIKDIQHFSRRSTYISSNLRQNMQNNRGSILVLTRWTDKSSKERMKSKENWQFW